MSCPLDLQPGLVVLGRWRLVELAGRGGCGETWRAAPVHGGPDVALKVVDRATRAQVLVREAATLHGLHHPHVVRFLGIVELPDEAVSWMILEWVSGGTLSTWLRRRERSAEVVGPMLAQLADAVGWLHQRDVVHRDLKPGNILLESGEGRPHLKLADFGLAGMGPCGFAAGTPGFTAPEVWLGRSIGPAVDLYSLGAVAWTMLHGADPAAMTGSPCPDRDALRACLGPERAEAAARLDELAMDLMDPDPRRRPALAEVVARLGAVDRPRPSVELPARGSSRASLPPTRGARHRL